MSRIFLLALAAAIGASIAQDTLVFEDNFDTLDFDKWSHEITLGGGGNWEFEYYNNNRSNSYVRNSTLFIKPTLTADFIGEAAVLNGGTLDLWGSSPANMCTGNAFYGCSRTSGGGALINPIQSARIRTVNSFAFKYGKLEVRAKLPVGDWLWPAIWMMPKNNVYGEWPASGEIDIVESRGNDATYSGGGINQFGSALHWGPVMNSDQYPLTHKTYTLPTGDFSTDFHTFGLLWTNTSLVTYVDDPTNVVLSVPMTQTFWELGGWGNSTFTNPWTGSGVNAPFDQEYYIILNVACGGVSGYFPDSVGNKPWSDKSGTAAGDFYAKKADWMATWKGEDSALQVDWVKVWQ